MADDALLTWLRRWFADEMARGRDLADVTAQLRASREMLVLFAAAVAETDARQTDKMCEALNRAFARADG